MIILDKTNFKNLMNKLSEKGPANRIFSFAVGVLIGGLIVIVIYEGIKLVF